MFFEQPEIKIAYYKNQDTYTYPYKGRI